MPEKKFFEFKNKTDDSADLYIYGDIVSYKWFENDVTASDFQKELAKIGDVKTLNIFINSYGGDVFQGQAIYSMLKRNKATKNVYIDGIAASCASLIAMAGDKIIMPANAMMMIHRAWTIGIGNANDFREQADLMDKIDESIMATYQAKTGMEIDKIKELMDAETWMTAEEAKDYGFADEVEAEKLVAASISGGELIFNGLSAKLSRFKHPESIATRFVAHIEEKKPDPPKDPDPDPPKDPEEPRPAPVDFYKFQILRNERRLKSYGL